MYYTLSDPRNRLVIFLSGVFSLSLALLIYLLKLYISGPTTSFAPISSIKSDIIVHANPAGGAPHLRVSEDINFTSSANTFGSSFVRLFDVNSPAAGGAGAGLRYQVGMSTVDGIDSPETSLSKGEFFYKYPVKSGLGSFQEGAHHLTLDYTVRGAAVLNYEGRSHLTWNVFHPWPGRTGSVATNVILPSHVRADDVIFSAEIWEKDSRISINDDVLTLVRDFRLMGDGIPRVMLSFQTSRQLEEWEYLRVILSWPLG